MTTKRLVSLDADHPGFRDPLYQARRNELADLARAHREGEPVPRVRYTAAEERVWREVWDALGPQHDRLVHTEILGGQRALDLRHGPLPQLEDLNARLARTGFRMEPVAGLVAPRDFLEALGRGTFLSTQYLRHGSRPLYTPEPDLVHELVGHAASLVHPRIAALTRAFGEEAARADDRAIDRLVRVYWWTLEFGLAVEDGEPRAVGAGLLSSAGELAGSVDVVKGPWDVEVMAETPYDPTRPNPLLFLAPSLEAMIDDVRAWLPRAHRAAPTWRGGASSAGAGRVGSGT